MTRKTCALALVAAVFMLNTAAVRAEDPPKMTPEQEAAMKAWTEFATPGPEHQQLKHFVGNWDAAVKMWMEPGAPVQESTATSTGEMIFGDRYLLMKHEGMFEGEPFHGMAITGFNNMTKKFNSLWIDSEGTGFYLTTGTCDKDHKVCTDTGTMDDPVSKTEMAVRQVTTHVSDTKITMEMYQTPAGGKEYKTMEITYTKK
ncbi:MAG: DUF1579 domain-containing protein [Candidatus Schekmanbacteria bacterium]|nr:DUF1579 domain-containing protein [Candidatus Schekmanbacteria bacterium]